MIRPGESRNFRLRRDTYDVLLEDCDRSPLLVEEDIPIGYASPVINARLALSTDLYYDGRHAEARDDLWDVGTFVVEDDDT
jgi:hypothetical protein